MVLPHLLIFNKVMQNYIKKLAKTIEYLENHYIFAVKYGSGIDSDAENGDGYAPGCCLCELQTVETLLIKEE